MTDDKLLTLVQGLQRGDNGAFETLINQYKTYVYSLAYARVSNFTDAEDIAQMVFVEVYKHVSGLREPGKFLNWLHGICDRVSLNWLRQNRQRTVSLDEVGSPAHKAMCGRVTQHNPVEILTTAEETQSELKRAREIYNDLEPDYRLVLNLKYMEGLSYEEIAQRLGVSKTVVRGRLYRAHKYLRKLLPNSLP